jgi:hypothetical protein
MSTLPLLQTLATTTPALYTCLTFAYTHVAIPPLTTHAPPKLLAKQWLQAYRTAPIYVAPLILLGASSNALLFYLTCNAAYAVAALANASIIPYTVLYMEPGINGAGKWKAQALLKDEEGVVVLRGRGSGTDRDTASEGAKRWAESVGMREIVERWARVNMWRYVITGFAVVVSASATVVMS